MGDDGGVDGVGLGMVGVRHQWGCNIWSKML